MNGFGVITINVPINLRDSLCFYKNRLRVHLINLCQQILTKEIGFSKSLSGNILSLVHSKYRIIYKVKHPRDFLSFKSDDFLYVVVIHKSIMNDESLKTRSATFKLYSEKVFSSIKICHRPR